MQELMLLLSKLDGFWCHSRQVAEQIPLVFVLVIEIRRSLVAIFKVVANKYDKDSCVSTVVSSSAWAKYKTFDIQLGSTHAAVAPKISALRAFVSKPTTRANSDVKSTISPTLTLMLRSDTRSKHTMAPVKSIALNNTETTAPALSIRR